MSLKKKFLFLYLFCFIVPFFSLAFFLVTSVTASLENALVTSMQISLNQTDQLVENTIREATSYLSKLAGDSRIQDIFSTYHADLPTQVGNMLYLKKTHVTYAADYQTVFRPRFYANNGEYYWDTNEGFFFDMDRFSGQEWFQETERRYPYLACLPRRLSPEEGYIRFAVSLHDANQYQKITGVICADVSEESFRGILQSAADGYDSRTYLVDSGGDLVCSLSGETDDEAFLDNLSSLFAHDGEKISYCGGSYFVFSRPLSGSTWTRVTLVPQSAVSRDVFSKTLVGYLLFLIGGTAAFCFAYTAFRVVIRRLDLLKARMAEVRHDRLLPVENDTHDEIGELMDGYNFMVEKVQTLLRKQYELGLQVKDAELKALQAQINPHFLYNALSMVNWLSEEERPQDITRVISALSRFYRLSLNHGEDTITLREELQLTECFVYIQKMRYDSEIVLETEVEEDCLDVKLPKLTLQPIVENAIAHGILPKPVKDGIIRIAGKRDGTALLLTVSDDGLGMSPERLMQVRENRVESGSGNRYGIKNVKERLALCFERGFAFGVESEPGCGTCVTLRLELPQ